jgi:hypothetical protein
MGFRISWLAIEGADKDTICERLGLKPTGRTSFAFDPNDPIAVKQLPSGWMIVGFNEMYHELVRDEKVKRLSDGWTVMACNLCETTMCSSASLWKSSREIWSVYHFSEEDRPDLETEGDLPPAFTAIEQTYRALQAERDREGSDVDCMIEVPMALAKQITSFVPDETSADFECMELSPREEKSASKPWWRFGH